MDKKQILFIVFFTVFCIMAAWYFFPASSVFVKGNTDDYARVYAPVAYNIIEGKGHTLHGEVSFEYPPGFSFMLAACFFIAKILDMSEEVVFNAAKLLLMVAANIMILLISRIFWKGKRAIIVPVLWIAYPLMLWIPCQRNSELLFLPVFYTAVYLFLLFHFQSKTKQRGIWYAAGSGVLFGCAMLVRPIALFIPLILIVVYLITAKKSLFSKAANALVILVAAGMVILPWELWIYSKTGKIILLSSRDAVSMYDGLTFESVSAGYNQSLKLPSDVKMLTQKIASRGVEAYETKGDILQTVYQEFRKAPWTVIKLYTIKAARVWYGTNSNRYEAVILFSQVLFMGLWLLMQVKIWNNRNMRELSVYIITMTAYFWLMGIMVLSIVRYLVPVLGLLFAFTPALLDYLPVSNTRRGVRDRF